MNVPIEGSLLGESEPFFTPALGAQVKVGTPAAAQNFVRRPWPRSSHLRYATPVEKGFEPA